VKFALRGRVAEVVLGRLNHISQPKKNPGSLNESWSEDLVDFLSSSVRREMSFDLEK
jgi:hypothetical protein